VSFIDPADDCWAQAQMDRVAGRCFYCGKQRDDIGWATHDRWGDHLICRKCFDNLDDAEHDGAPR
jgi:hypothetical protein